MVARRAAWHKMRQRFATFLVVIFFQRQPRQSLAFRLANSRVSRRITSIDSCQRIKFPRGQPLKTSRVPIDGLVNDFDRRSKINKTIQLLRYQIPSLVSIPLTEEVAKDVYTSDSRLVVGEVELATSREEIVSLADTLFLASQASRQAARFFDPKLNVNSTNPIDAVLYIDHELRAIHVQWNASLLPLPKRPGEIASSRNRLMGSSQLMLDEQGKVFRHRILNLTWNGQQQNAEMIGRSLSSIRQTVRSLQSSSILQGIFDNSVPILNQVRDDILQQLTPKTSNIAPVPIKMSTTINASSIPLPGSSEWPLYARAHRNIEQFVYKVVPILSGEEKYADSLQNFFARDVILSTIDGSALLQGASRVANFYQSLASLRARTFGTWKLQRAQVLQWTSQIKVTIDYVTTTQIPGADFVTSTTGTDLYTLDIDTDTPRILSISQKKLHIGNTSNTQDALWFMRSIATAIETGRFRSKSPESIWTDLLQRITGSNTKLALTTKTESLQQRSDNAAITAYRIMTSLNQELRSLVDTNCTSNLPPAADFLTENILLRGYVGEPLIKGRIQYIRNLGFVSNALRRSLLSGRLKSEREPLVVVSLTNMENIRVDLTLYLKLAALPGLPESSGLPLRIHITSEYQLDDDSGKIVAHELVESAVNGQRTPGDLVAQWVRQRSSESSTGDDWKRLLSDSLQWLLQIGQRG